MAGSNRTPASPHGHIPPHWGTPEADVTNPPLGHPHPGQGQHPAGEALSRWSPPQQVYGQPQQHQPQPVYQQAPAQQQAYVPPQSYVHPGQPVPPQFGYPQAQPDPYTQPPTQPGYAADAQQRQTYDRYAQQQPAAHAQPGHYDTHQAHADPHALSYPADAQRGYAPAQPQAYPQGYPAQPPHAPAAPAYAQPAAEPQNWDLNHYAPGQPQQHGQAAQFGAAHTLGHDPRYAQPPQHGNWPAQPASHAIADPAFDTDRYTQQGQQGQGYAPQHAQPGHGHQAYAQPGYDQQQPDVGQQAVEDFGYEEEPVEEKRRGPRAMVVVGALVGAIVVGGGLAMGYQMFAGGKSDGKATPVVKAAATPVKTKPADAGGREMADQDKKFANRLSGGSATTTTAEQSQVAGASAAGDPDAPRKVQTVVVNRDGTITPQIQQAAAPAIPSPLPGMVVDGGLPAGRPQLRGAAPQGEPVTTPVARQAPAVPKVADLPLPKVKKEVTGEAPAAATPPPPKKKVAARDDLAAPKGETAVSSGAGFVAALTSKKSRVDALGAFANLQQSYADLQGKVPDVKEVDLGAEKGTWYRLVVGPPGSKESASDLCKKLKAQGLKDCWVTAY